MRRSLSDFIPLLLNDDFLKSLRRFEANSPSVSLGESWIQEKPLAAGILPSRNGSLSTRMNTAAILTPDILGRGEAIEDKEEKALQSALAEIRSRPPVGRRRRPHDCSSVVRILFSEISELRHSWKH